MSDHSRKEQAATDAGGWKKRLGALASLLVKPLLFLVAGAALIAGLGLAQRAGWITSGSGSGGKGDGGQTQASSEKNERYICPMMCTPPLSEPGRCPVCGMELVPAASSDSGGEGSSIAVDPVARRVAHIETVPAELKAVLREIRAIGRIGFDEGKLKTLAAYVDGRIERLFADYTGVVVNQGDELAVLYSPELYTAQSELLAARRAAERAESSEFVGSLDSGGLAASAEQKLLDLGMTEAQIEEVIRSGQPDTRVKLVAPIHGTVIDRLAAEGDYVSTGEPIYRLADLSTVWLMLELFPRDAAAVRYGQRVQARVESLPGRTFSGRVAFIDPTVDPKTRTVGVRVVIENDDGHLKVGDYATATIATPVVTGEGPTGAIYDPELAGKWISPRHPHVIEDEPGDCKICGIDLVPASELGFTSEPIADRKELVVPRNAVLMAGENSVVYVETEPGRFELRRVTLGPSLGEEIVLLSGVKPGEEVATNGNFLIDSQMQLTGKPSLIDPTEAAPKATEPEKDAKVEKALAQLPEAKREAAREQGICPVTEAPLGSMGVPKEVEVAGRTVFICCEGCREPLLDEPEKYLAVLESHRKQKKEGGATTATHGTEPPSNLPPVGPIELLDDDAEQQRSPTSAPGPAPPGPIETPAEDKQAAPSAPSPAAPSGPIQLEASP